jgi:hypothetical protein
VAKVADPALNVPVPSVVVPSLNVTVPLGVPAAGADAETVAVKVTDWPEPEGLAELTTAVALFPLFTVWLSTDEVLAVKFVSAP